jgi:hypothetical protein
MKKIVFLFALMTSALAVSAADNIKEKATALTNNMETSLGLSADQKAKLFEINLKKMETIEKLAKADNKEESTREIMVERRKYIMEVREILTPEQYKSWAVMRTEQIHAIKKGEKVEKPIVDKTTEQMLNN